MVSYKTQLIAAILLISEAYSQILPSGCGCPQRCGPATAPSTGSFIPGGKFVIPAIIKPILPTNQPASCIPYKPPVVSSSACAEEDDDSELEKLLYLLICNIIENRKGSGRKQSSSSVAECNASSGAGSSDTYESYYGGSYGEDYDCGGLPGPYATPVYGSGNDQIYTASSSDNDSPEIVVYVRPYSVD